MDKELHDSSKIPLCSVSHFYSTAEHCIRGALGHPVSAGPSPGDTDTRPQVAIWTRNSSAHPGPSPTLKQRRQWVFYSCYHACTPPGATSIVENCSRGPEQRIPHQQGRALCREGSCARSPERTEPQVSSPCTASFGGLTESRGSCSTSSGPCHSSLLGDRPVNPSPAKGRFLSPHPAGRLGPAVGRGNRSAA